jgi:hypothetical protein
VEKYSPVFLSDVDIAGIISVLIIIYPKTTIAPGITPLLIRLIAYTAEIAGVN